MLDLFAITTGPVYDSAKSRWVSLTLASVVVFSELVYDMDADGNRTEEQAVSNFAHVFASQLRNALEHANG